MKYFHYFQFSYGPLIWMTNSRGLNNKTNHVQEKALHIALERLLNIVRGVIS